ncbi:MAG: fumarylacetoacetate hydrolase family protein [Planctomycetes bacterium]|nr:fumarylacetoacetate hydrolase family protein [Planctomycetota bacterium]
MRLVRFLAGDRVRYGVLEGDTVRELLRPYFENVVPMRSEHRLADVRLLAPARPSKMLCIGLNYRDHAREMQKPLPDEPVLFLKPATALAGPGEPIVCPKAAGRVDYEAELAVVIRRRCRSVAPEDADRAILGYACFNDVTARDLQAKDGQWTRAKGFDTFGVLGPWIETAPGDPNRLAVACRLNGAVKQRSSTDQLVFNCQYLVSWASRIMTLEAGDVIATGTPAGVGPMKPGDAVEVEVEGIGVLASPVAAEPERGAKPRAIL